MKYLFLEEIDSTNKYAKEHISEIDNMTVVYTYNQTAGRGRLERKWTYIGDGNIYASIVIKPNTEMKPVYANLTQLLSLVIAQTMEEYKVIPKIKWPNDVRIDGRKISGILAESTVVQGGFSKNSVGIILGFGVNLNTDKKQLEQINQAATSLNIETGVNIDKELFLQKVLERFCLLYNKFVEEGFLLIREEYKKRAEFLNKEISVKVFDKLYEGRAVDITESGAIKLVDKNKKEHILLIGDIL